MRSELELLVDCLTRLNQVAVPYMLTGSMASNYWGIPRSTHDLDFVLQFDSSFVDPMIAAFDDAYFIQRSSVQSALSPPYQFNAIDEQSAFKVDFWILRDDPYERNAFERRIQVMLLDTLAWIATAEDLILHKLFWNTIGPSDRQLADAAGVYTVQADRLDKAYLDYWSRKLQVEQALRDLQTGRKRPKST